MKYIIFGSSDITKLLGFYAQYLLLILRSLSLSPMTDIGDTNLQVFLQ